MGVGGGGQRGLEPPTFKVEGQSPLISAEKIQNFYFHI